MGNHWTAEELLLIKTFYESGLTVKETYKKYCEIFGENRTEGAIGLAIKRHKYKHTKEQTSKLKSLATKGEKNPMFGKKSWSFGLTKETNDSLKSTSIKRSIAMKQLYKDGVLKGWVSMRGKSPWCKGLTSKTDERVKKIGEKLGIFSKERWKNYSQEEKDLVIGRMTQAANKRKNNTAIEHRTKVVLDDLQIEYVQQFRVKRFVMDFYIEKYNLVIECQGDYWHGNPEKFKTLNNVQLKNIERDKNKKIYLNDNNINFLFIWETDINKGNEALKKIILDFIENMQ